MVPACGSCGGALKPDVVFFGENVPVARVERCYAAVEALADLDGALLVAGSSLTVMSGLRFVRRAAKLGVPVVIVNRGLTRGDELASYKVDAGTSDWLPALAAASSPQRRLTKMWSAASGKISADSPPEPTSTPSAVAWMVIVLSGRAPTRRMALISASSFCISSEIRRTSARLGSTAGGLGQRLDVRHEGLAEVVLAELGQAGDRVAVGRLGRVVEQLEQPALDGL